MRNELIGFNKEIAGRCGVGAAVIASFLRNELIFGANNLDVIESHGYLWVRCSQKKLSYMFPFMSVDMVASAIGRLCKAGLLKKDCLNADKFDHTNWYAFTSYGWDLMKHDPMCACDDDYIDDDYIEEDDFDELEERGDVYDRAEDLGNEIARIVFGYRS